MKTAIALVFAFLFGWNRSATAHPVAQGTAELSVQKHELHATFRVSNEQVFVASTFGKAKTKPSSTPTLENLWHDHAVYLLERVQMEADGMTLKGHLLSVKEPQDFTVNGFTEYVLRFPFPDESPKVLRISESLLREIEFAPGNPWETTFATRIRQEGRLVEEARLLTTKQPIEISLQWQGLAASPRKPWILASGISFAALALLYAKLHTRRGPFSFLQRRPNEKLN